MTTKKYKISNRILSLVLTFVMVLGMLPMTAYAATEEAEALTNPPPVTYNEGVTQYLKSKNYLFKAEFKNINSGYIQEVYIISVGEDSYSELWLQGTRSTRLYDSQLEQLKWSNLPKNVGGILQCYTNSDDIALNKKNPIVTITCVGVKTPEWSWDGTSSATAVFTSTDGKATMKVNADITSSTQSATNCLGKDTVTYTATATANGQTYTDTQTEYGEAGPHSYTYSAKDNVITETCSNGCEHNATATLSLDRSASLKYTGSAIQPLKVEYSDGWQGDTLAITYSNNTAVSTDTVKATGSIAKGTTTATLNFTITKGTMSGISVNGYSGVYDGKEHSISIMNVPSDATVKYSTSENGTYTTTNPTYTKKGTYEVWYKIEKENYETVSGSESVVISQATNSWSTEPSVDEWTYGETPKAPSAAAKFGTVKVEYRLASGTDNDYTTTVPTESGSYLVRFSVEGNDNYTSLTKVVKLKIAQVKLTVTANDKSKIYGESDPALTWQITEGELVGTDELTGISVSRAEGNSAKDYAITVSQTEGANSNYDITFKDGTFTIKQKEVDISWETTEFLPYTGSSLVPKANVTNLEAGDECILTTEVVETTDGAGIIPGKWKAKVTALSNDNYKLPESGVHVEVPFEIVYASQNHAPDGVSGVNETIDGKADGKITGVDSTMEYRKDGETEYTAINGTEATDLADGTYYVRYAAKTYYNASPDTKVIISAGNKLNITIPIPESQNGYTLTVDKYTVSWNESVELTFALKEGYSKTDGFTVRVNDVPVTLETDDKYTISNIQTNRIITVEGVADITAPTATIKVVDTNNEWKEFISNITFDIFFNKTQSVTITAEDVNTGSGLDKVYYYLSEAEIAEANIADVTGWIEYTSQFNIDPDKEYIIYAKATDKAGNTVYINSDGLVLDATAPVITGIENNGTYYGDTVFRVTESYLDTVTLDNATITLTDGKYTITADDKEHTIIATDKATNTSTTIKIKVVAIASLDDEIESITTSNVKSSDKEEIKEVLDFVNSLIDSGKDFTVSEDEKLNEIKSNAEELLNRIENAKDAADNETTGKVDNITSDNVNISDKENLKDAKDDLEQALQDYPDNFTESEKAAIEADIQRLEDSIKSIEKVEETVSKITNLPEEVEPDDLETVDKIKDAKNAYDLLTDHEKSLLNSEDKEKLVSLLAQSTDYKIIEGDGSSIREDSNGTLHFKANGAYIEFTGIKVDNNIVDTQYYTAESGSTIITLKNEFLDKLSVGAHSLTVMYTDGETTGSFTIKEKPSSSGSKGDDINAAATQEKNVPLTGDKSNTALYVTTLILSATGLILLTAIKRRERN